MSRGPGGTLARLAALSITLFGVSLLEKVAAQAAVDAAAARAAAHTADEALFAHLTGGDCSCPEPAQAPEEDPAC